jgi:hypothetical protein
MKNLAIRTAILAAALVLGAGQLAHASVFSPLPEIDPGLAITAGALLAGGLVVLRARRK